MTSVCGSESTPRPSPAGATQTGRRARPAQRARARRRQLSAGVSKTFSITERLRLKAESTFTNVLNHTNLSDPNMDISSPSFGLISSAKTADTGGARSGQVSMRLDF